MSTPDALFIDPIVAASARPPRCWPSVLIPRSRIDAEIERLSNVSRSGHGARASQIVHPLATAPGLGLAPGIDVTLNVLLPGESTSPVRRNSTQIDMCMRGGGRIVVGERSFSVERFDVWNTPSHQWHSSRNDSNEPWVRLTYSNAPLLKQLEVHVIEDATADTDLTSRPTEEESKDRVRTKRAREAADRIVLTPDGAELLGYEYLIDIDGVRSEALLWPWRLVEPELRNVRNLGQGYTGRRLYVLYNPSTGRLIGTSSSFFATIAAVPAGNIDAPHRHTSAAINYYFEGHGGSTVMGEKFEWEAGDLMLSAPGWAVHNHRSRREGFLALTIQDHPLHISMESLLWQETLKSPIRLLGSEPGFQTNRALFSAGV